MSKEESNLNVEFEKKNQFLFGTVSHEIKLYCKYFKLECRKCQSLEAAFDNKNVKTIEKNAVSVRCATLIPYIFIHF